MLAGVAGTDSCSDDSLGRVDSSYPTPRRRLESVPESVPVASCLYIGTPLWRWVQREEFFRGESYLHLQSVVNLVTSLVPLVFLPKWHIRDRYLCRYREHLYEATNDALKA
jgi:hypothetical protein